MRILQTNLGRSRRAQDLLYQTVRESAVALAVVAEPYRVLDAPDWTGDADGMVAVTWTSTPGAHTYGVPLERGNGYVAVEWAGMVVVGVYVSPNSGWAAFEEFLDGIGDCVRRHFPRRILVLGDCNAHSAEWGNPRTNARGRALSDWAAGLGLLLVNRGTTSTCVTWRGNSVVDITWASPDTFTGWRVAEGIETLSDHLYIFMKVKGMPEPGTVTAGNGRDTRRRGSARPPPRWKSKEKDGDLLRAAATVAAWNWEAPMTQTETSVEEEAENLRRDMTAICDASMPRTTLGTGRSRAVHWWTPDIAELRARCVRARRRYLRARSWRRRNEEEVPRRYQVYRVLRRSLQKAITAAKNRAWSELVEAVEADPWGRPYKTVTRKLRAKGPLATAEMEPELLQQIVETLFPSQEDSAAEQLQDTAWTGEWTDDW
ncbi:uncharacterized protein LOC122577494 [Bombus pyrosoma]|uniref:uncharacterized protein LOC122577494 n=1 Tax=Bombus pyrosoma TaxID=396416 RepID=UPI001CB9C71E|nr:uncharacterized protein LOC122577494 [Bombus pyrosoma]